MNVKQNFDTIMEQLKYHLPNLQKDFSVEGIGIFGSVVQGKAKPESDVDILVDFSSPPGFFTFIRLEERLSSILHRKVDLVTKNAIKNAVKSEILQQVIYV
ncbi:nucleotidyltransferase family protein [Candidatus Gottesmanbacteria bacterium]|nr:nucleotidyltransferase family protein [Candidatus Gottesmanbacteria bacterium]